MDMQQVFWNTLTLVQYYGWFNAQPGIQGEHNKFCWTQETWRRGGQLSPLYSSEKTPWQTISAQTGRGGENHDIKHKPCNLVKAVKNKQAGMKFTFCVDLSEV